MDESLTSTALGRYQLVRRIGRGGMGEVWLAGDPRLQRQVAIKVLPLRKRDDQEFLVRFEREARAAAALHHPHILPVHDYGQQQMPDDQTVTYLVMSYVSGGSLEDRLKRVASGHGTLTQDEALAYLFQVAEAIDYAHTHGIIHRDIKPANMLLREDNLLLLTDFGIARILIDSDSSTKTGASLGTPTYMAPEQAQGQAVPASDLYSLAIVAYQLFTGRVPFQADNPYALTFQHAFAAPTSPRVYNPSLSPQFEAALLRGLAKDPAQRPLSATAFVTSLRQALDLSPSPPPASTILQPEPAQDIAKRHTRRNVLLGIGAGALLVGGGTAAYLLSSPGHNKPTVLKSTSTSTHPHGAANAPLVITAAFSKAVTQMAWSPVKNVLLMANLDNNDEGQVTLWNMPVAGQSTSPSQFASHSFNNGGVSILPAWSPDGTKIALANGGLDLDSETLFYTSNLSAPVPGIPDNSIHINNNFSGLEWLSNTALATLEQGAKFTSLVLKIWNIQHPQSSPVVVTINQEPTLDLLTPHNLLAISSNGSAIAVGTATGIQVGQVRTTGKQAVWQALSPLLSLQNNVAAIIGWSADGRFVAALNDTSVSAGYLGVWDATQNYALAQPALELSVLASGPSCFAWGPASQKHLLAISGVNGQVALWNVGGNAAPQRTLPGSIAGTVTALAWSADGQWLAASYNDAASSIVIWKV